MPRAIWSGAISFGLVNVPIKLFTATSQKDVRFHQLHDKDGARIQQKRVCSKDGEEVPMEHIVKGYEVSRDKYVLITPEELDALDPKATRTIDILDFVDLDEIDPVYFDSTYYMVPEKGAGKAYALLLEAMRKSKKVAIARVVLRQKQHLVALRPLRNALSMETMLYADEVVSPETLEGLPEDVEVTDRELAMAQQLIDSLADDFKPGALQGRLPRARARDDRAQGGRPGDRRRRGRGGAGSGRRPDGRPRGKPRRRQDPPRSRTGGGEAGQAGA